MCTIGRMLLWAIKSDVWLQKENDMFKFESSFILMCIRSTVSNCNNEDALNVPVVRRFLLFFLVCDAHKTQSN